MKKLASHHPERVVELVAGQLAMERETLVLHDALLGLLRATPQPAAPRLADILARSRDEAATHVAWLEQQLQSLGRDPAAPIPPPLVTYVPDTAPGSPVVRMLRALLAVELVSNAGWELLADLAGATGDDTRDTLQAFLGEQDEHVRIVRQSIARIVRGDVLGEVERRRAGRYSPGPRLDG